MRFGTYYFLQAPPALAHAEVFRREIEQMAWTEELGFDSLWLTEHHFIEYGLSVSPTVLAAAAAMRTRRVRSEEHTSELQSRPHLVCRLLLEKKKNYE